jgi:hypothetical protein
MRFLEAFFSVESDCGPEDTPAKLEINDRRFIADMLSFAYADPCTEHMSAKAQGLCRLSHKKLKVRRIGKHKGLTECRMIDSAKEFGRCID